jgi:hypothetical protein
MYYTEIMGLPNFIFILTPHHPHTIWEGNDPKIKTPYLRALALHGTYFSNAYSPISMESTNINELLSKSFFDPLKTTMESKQYTSALIGDEPSIRGMATSFTHALTLEPSSHHIISSLGDETVRVIKNLTEPFFLALVMPKFSTDRQNLSAERSHIQEIDRQTGRVLATLSARGYTNNIFIYAGLTGDDSSTDENRTGFEDSSIKVPMVISGILGQQRNTTVKSPVSILNVIPTIEAIILEKTGSLKDHSLLALLKDPHAAQPKYVYLENDAGARIIRTQRYKLIMQPNAHDGILYDLQQDSGETNNLFGRPATMGEQLRLQQLIADNDGN